MNTLVKKFTYIHVNVVEPTRDIFNTNYMGKGGPGTHIFGLFKGENLIKVHCNCKIIVKPVTFYTFLTFLCPKP